LLSFIPVNISYATNGYQCDLSNQKISNTNVVNKILTCQNKTSIDLSGNNLTSLVGISDNQAFTSNIEKINLSNNAISDWNTSYNFDGITNSTDFIISPQRADVNTVKTTPNTAFDSPIINPDETTIDENNQFVSTPNQLASSYAIAYGGGYYRTVSQGHWSYDPETRFDEGGYKEGNISYYQNVDIPFNKYQINVPKETYLPFMYDVTEVSSTKYQIVIENEIPYSYTTQEYGLTNKKECDDDVAYYNKSAFVGSNSQFNKANVSTEKLCVKRTFTQPNKPFLEEQGGISVSVGTISGANYLSLGYNRTSPLAPISLTFTNNKTVKIPTYKKSLFILKDQNSPLNVTVEGKNTIFGNTDSQTDVKRTIILNNITLTDQDNFPISRRIYFSGNMTSSPKVVCTNVECSQGNGFIQISNGKTNTPKIEIKFDNIYQQLTVIINVNYVKPPSLAWYSTTSLLCYNTYCFNPDKQSDCIAEAYTNEVSELKVIEPDIITCYSYGHIDGIDKTAPKNISTLTKDADGDKKINWEYKIDIVKWFKAVGNLCRGPAEFRVNFKSTRTYNGQIMEKEDYQTFKVTVWHKSGKSYGYDIEHKIRFRIKVFSNGFIYCEFHIANSSAYFFLGLILCFSP
jgi:hypothetical protein